MHVGVGGQETILVEGFTDGAGAGAASRHEGASGEEVGSIRGAGGTRV